MHRPPITSSLLFAALLFSQSLAANEPMDVEKDPHEACSAALLNPHPRSDRLAYEPCKGLFLEVLRFRGTRSVISVEQGQDRLTEHSICLPAAISPFHLTRAFIRWAKSNPVDLEEHLEAGLVLAVEESYPCGGPWKSDAEAPGVERALATNGERIPDYCPLCGSHQVQQIIYGLPGPDFDTTRFASGGCIGGGRGSAKWHCSGCGHEWGLRDR